MRYGKVATLVASSAFLVFFMFFQGSIALGDQTEHKLVIQISTDDLRAQQTALTNIVNVQKHYGIDNIEIEVIAFGPGYRMLTPQSPLASRIASLAMQEVTFTACMNTLIALKEKTGFMPKLIEGVTTTKAGVVRIIELQEQGYSYVKY